MPSILLVRHGQASFGGPDYAVLSDTGHRQAAAVADELRARGVRVGRLVCGGLARQRDTAAPLAEWLGVDAEVDPRWDEYSTEDLATALEAAGIDDALIADDTASRERLWRLRESHTEAISAAGVPHKLDVGVPLARLAEFLHRVPEAARAAGRDTRTILFGHLGDGNVHVNVLGPEPGDERADLAVLELVAACGGTISAEHGVGVAKAAHLGLVRPPEELAAMRAIKRALDPHGIMNPGKLVPL